MLKEFKMSRVVVLLIFVTSVLFVADYSGLVQFIILMIFHFTIPIVLLLYLLTKSPFFSFIGIIQISIIAFLTIESYIKDYEYKVAIDYKEPFEAGSFIKDSSYSVEGNITDLGEIRYDIYGDKRVTYTTNFNTLNCLEYSVKNKQKIKTANCYRNSVLVSFFKKPFFDYYLKKSAKYKSVRYLESDYTKSKKRKKYIDFTYCDRVDNTAFLCDRVSIKRDKNSTRFVANKAWQDATIEGNPKFALYDNNKNLIYAVYTNEPNRIYILKNRDYKTIIMAQRRVENIIKEALLRWWQNDKYSIKIDKESRKLIEEEFKKIAKRYFVSLKSDIKIKDNRVVVAFQSYTKRDKIYIFELDKKFNFKKFYTAKNSFEKEKHRLNRVLKAIKENSIEHMPMYLTALKSLNKESHLHLYFYDFLQKIEDKEALVKIEKFKNEYPILYTFLVQKYKLKTNKDTFFWPNLRSNLMKLTEDYLEVLHKEEPLAARAEVEKILNQKQNFFKEFFVLYKLKYAKDMKKLAKAIMIKDKNKFDKYFVFYTNDFDKEFHFLFNAVGSHFVYGVKKLLDAGAKMDIKKHNHSPYQRALNSRNIKIIELFLKHGAKVDAKFAKYDFAYTHAIEQCNIEAVKLFIKYGLDVDAISKNYKRKVKRCFESGRNYILCKSKSRFLELGKLINGW
jgi:hypothetical protein